MSRSFRWNGSSSGGVVLSVTALVAISAVALAVDGQLARSGPPAVSLAVGAVICARLADRLAAEGAIRLALAFVLASLVALPPMASVAVAGLAGVAGRGRGVGLSGGDRPRALVSLVVGVATTEVLGLGLGGRLPREAWGGLPWLVVGFVVLHLVDRATPGAEPQRRLARRSRWLLASCNLPLAWFLVRIHFEFHWAEALIVVAVVTGFQAALARLDGTIRALRASNRQLAVRLTELDVLRSISAEIVASLVPGHVFDAVDRGCRRVFDVDGCLIALVDRRSGQPEVAHRSGPATTDVGGPLDRSAFAWAIGSAAGVRVDDLRCGPKLPAAVATVVGRRARSMIGVPLSVEDRVIGLLSIWSGRVAAYDDHQLHLLRTVGQQAAMAIENARHYELATVDALTRFHLRDYFFGRVAEEIRRCRRYGGRFCLLMLDLDGFKRVNDEHGHPVGDEFLRLVSATIRQQLRAADLPCRYGGDEFCVLLPETDIDGATAIAERIRKEVGSRPLYPRGLELRASVSIGLTAFPDHPSETIETLVQNADAALYEAKRLGRNRLVTFAA